MHQIYLEKNQGNFDQGYLGEILNYLVHRRLEDDFHSGKTQKPADNKQMNFDPNLNKCEKFIHK
jgi:hypothetical protein